MRKISILGVEVYRGGEAECTAVLQSFLDDKGGGVHHVVTVNPEFIMEARHNRAFRSVLNNADLATPDGVGIVLAARLLGTHVSGRATGVALVHRLAEMAAAQGKGMFLLGAAPGVAEEAADVLLARYPGLKVTGTYAGSPRDEDYSEIIRRLAEARPDILLVAYGAPAQDMWIARHKGDLPGSVRVAMGVGGVFDYLSGRVPLAPAAMRKLGLEWLYRLVKQPWRWRRILRVFQFGIIVIGVALREKLLPAGGSRPPIKR